MNSELQRLLTDTLHNGNHSCVIANGGSLRSFDRRGVADLYHLLTTEPEALKGASVADKVVGKGAAALLVAGEVEALYTDVISRPAFDMLSCAGVDVDYGQVVPHIINRSGTDWCPLELLCRSALSAEECLPIVESFVRSVAKDENDIVRS